MHGGDTIASTRNYSSRLHGWFVKGVVVTPRIQLGQRHHEHRLALLVRRWWYGGHVGCGVWLDGL